MDNKNNSDWTSRDNWNEYDWEMMMRRVDSFAEDYFLLVDRYGELPNSEGIILNKLEETGKLQPAEQEEMLIDYELVDSEDYEFNEDDFDEAGFFVESNPVYNLLQQVSLGWCNIFATFLAPEHRLIGVRILYSLGRAMAHLAGSLTEFDYEKPSCNIASAKRALAQINTALGDLETLSKLKPYYKKLTSTVKQHLREIQGKIVDHLTTLRSTAKTE